MDSGEAGERKRREERSPGDIGLRGHRTMNVERSEARRSAILHAAACVFDEKGYTASRVEDVATAMGVTKGVIYYYFRSKEEIFVEVMATGISGAIARLEAVLARGLPPVETLELVIRTHVAYNIDQDAPGHFAMLVASQLRSLSPEGREAVRGWQRKYGLLFRSVIERGMAEGVFKQRDVRITQNVIISAANYAAEWYRRRPTMNVEEVSAHVADQLVCGVLA